MDVLLYDVLPALHDDDVGILNDLDTTNSMRNRSSHPRSRWLAFAGAIVALLAISGCYIEWKQTHCPQFDPASMTWIDRCKQ